MDTGVFLQTFRAWVGHDANRTYIRGILDGVSQRSFIKEDIARKLRLKVVSEIRIALNTFGTETPSRAEKVNIVEVPLRSQHSSQVCVMQAIMVPVICHDVSTPSDDNKFVRQLRLEGKFIADERCFLGADADPGLSLLIGSDHLWQILTGELVRRTDTEGLVAMNSFFGWTLQGPIRYTAFMERDTNLMVCALRVDTSSEEEATSHILQSFWQLEAMGITGQCDSTPDQTLE